MALSHDTTQALRKRVSLWPLDEALAARIEAGEPVRYLIELTDANAFWTAFGASSLSDANLALQRLELAALGLAYVSARIDGDALVRLASLPGVGRVDVDEPQRLIEQTGGGRDESMD